MNVHCDGNSGLLNRGLAKRLLAVCLVIVGVSNSAQAITVEQFLAKRDQWPDLIGVSFKIEGRLSTAAGNIVILKNCKGIQFRSQKELPVFREKGLVVEVSGTLKKDDVGTVYLQVNGLRNLGTDLSRLNVKRNSLDRNDIEGLYALGKWAEKRGEEFKDQPLTAEAIKIYRSALQRERIALEKRRYIDLKRLAKKVDTYSLEPALKTSIIYEGYYVEWSAIRKDASANELLGWASKAKAELPGAEKKLEKYDPAMLKTFMDGPLQYHDNASPDRWPDVHRMLYLEIVRNGIKKLDDNLGKNGLVVADRLQELAPEFSEWAAEFRLRELNYRLTVVAKMRRSEMLSLRRDLDDYKRTEESKRVLDDWLRQRTIALRGEGAEGLLQLAADYDELKGDRVVATRMLLEAERVKPGLRKVAEKLEQFGFKRVNGIWKSPDQIVNVPDSPVVIAMCEGRVVKGMTAEQVEKTLGHPVTVTRVLTSRRLTEYWVYGNETADGFSVRLTRSNVTYPAIVDKIIDLVRR